MDLEIARQLARVSAAAYKPTLLAAAAAGAKVLPISVASSQGLVVANDTDLVMAFRGTEPGSLWDWLVDGMIARDRYLNAPGSWHQGFALAGRAVAFSTYVRAFDLYRGQRVWLTGHSLGGAIAGVVAAQLALWHEAPRVTGVYTFGAPRFADDTAARWLDGLYAGRYVRVEARRDRVPHLPPAWLGFRHVGEQVVIGEGRGLTLRNHPISAYVRTLEKEKSPE